MNRLTVIFLSAVLIIFAPIANAYDPGTHREIGHRAADPEVSSLDQVLKDELGLQRGIRENFQGLSVPGPRTVLELIGAGAFFEDLPITRQLNHFHNPLVEPWDAAGLRAFSFLGLSAVRGQSSVLWQQNTGQDTTFVFAPLPLLSGGENWSWQDARRRYLRALTGTSRDERARAFAETFETLGHLSHLIQDASVPAHVRNDPHPPFLFRRDWYEDWATRNSAKVLALLNSLPKGPTKSIFTSTGNSQAPIAIARLIDSDSFLGLNSQALSVQNIGIAEYTNGNFLSRGTIFRNFDLPQPASLESGDVLQVKPPKFRRYFKRMLPDATMIAHFVTEGMLFDSLVAAQGALPGAGGWHLDDLVHEDYAKELLPRAVGYSAALLDYFFRGKLDVDLVQPDSDNASLLQLIGANGSDDLLVDGTLTLYSDSPSGVRTAATSVPVNGVQKGQELFSTPVTFQASENAERFAVVYQGTLGLEKKEGTFPGGVIGKVLGGVRVEEVFSDGTRWRLRTPTGVFLLPLMVAEFEEVRWGDADNILVARTPFGPPDPNQPNRLNRIAAYELQRQAASTEPVTVDTPDGREAQLVRKSEAIFPFGMFLGTTVTFSHTIHYRQQIAIYEPRRTVFAFKPLGELTVCQFDHFELGTPAVKTVATRDFPFQGSFPVTLDLARNRIFGTVNQPYIWDLREVGAPADGRLLGLVVVSLTSPEGEAAFVPVIGLNQVTGVEEVVSQFGFSPAFPPVVGSPIWALVDLKTAEVVASTADPVLTMTGEETFEGFPGVWAHTEAIICDQTFSAWSKLPFAQTPPDIVEVNAQVQTRNGLFGLTVNGWLKNELNSLEGNGQPLFGVQLATLQGSGDFIYDCIPSEGINVCRAMGVTSTTGVLARGPAGLDEVRRARPAPGGERLVFLAGAGAGTTTPVATVFVWDATAGRARIRHEFLDVEGIHELGPATGATLLASTLVLSGEQLVPRASFLIPLDGTQGPILFPGVDLRESFALLNPSYLYSVQELKFFRSKPPLERTALPAKLADLPDRTNLVGDYHAIRLP